jgi:prepilin-type processing-associated H-X9-DG protein
LNRARESAKAIQCINQQKQALLALNFYASDSNDWYLSYNGNKAYTPTTSFPQYAVRLCNTGYIKGKYSSSYYVAREFTCVNVREKALFKDNMIGANYTYGIPQTYYDLDGNKKYMSEAAFKLSQTAFSQPSKFIYIADSATKSGRAWYCWGWVYSSNNCIADSHGGKSNFGYLDGHATSIKVPSEAYNKYKMVNFTTLLYK